VLDPTATAQDPMVMAQDFHN